MPFTLAHPAAVLPLLRGPLVPAALVAGSMAPDVPYFSPLRRSADAWYEPFVNATTTHRWPGMITVAVPTAAVLLLSWWLVRSPLRDLVGYRPARAGLPAPGSGALAAAGVAWVVLSLLIGVLSHVLWDSFTHGDGWVVQRVALLREPVLGSVELGRLLQHLSTVLGGAAVLVWGLRRHWRRRAGGERLEVRRWAGAVVAALVLVALVAGTIAAVSSRSGGATPEGVVSAGIKGAGAATVPGLLVYAVLWHVLTRRRPPRHAAGAEGPGRSPENDHART
ncbi:DUF4184 family protein [Trujillonella humicola]|uniref:DUF4184 family protein n=1 Tax=Trujillonella humicola TaxID=3383699 RepID=UPI0039060929